MNEQRRAEFFRLGPHRIEFRVGERHAVDVAADRGPLQSLLLHRGFELLHREVRRLQRQRGKACEAVGFRGAEFGELLVLDLDYLSRQIAVAVVPVGVDR
jgi:hypothetical protein